MPEVVSHLTAGSLGDLAASFIYVPSEVLKTRLQLQGNYNNPHFVSGYNYRNTWHATKMVNFYILFPTSLFLTHISRLLNMMGLVHYFMVLEQQF